jgi:hypothetical protein
LAHSYFRLSWLFLLRILFYLALWHVEVQGVNLLRAGIAHQHRRTVSGQAHPGHPIAEGATRSFMLPTYSTLWS